MDLKDLKWKIIEEKNICDEAALDTLSQEKKNLFLGEASGFSKVLSMIDSMNIESKIREGISLLVNRYDFKFTTYHIESDYAYIAIVNDPIYSALTCKIVANKAKLELVKKD